ncbi:zinc finger CCCH domain-containing protein 33-like [Hordeum vulgare subsp. vulgare]|uniref:C3H1-type domain-containing protein n=1 Tax=Hordeum vulgare subsp. vulgare TaxID=112509 RepID=A0A8I6XDW8_HORVV|nr:zinc finger CCCH domain-containing protein 33-like [Hordeum vulgare subsp. vulgare]
MCPGLRNLAAAMPPSAHDHPSSYLLELAADDDLPAFRRAVQEDNLSLVAASPWYGPSPKSTNNNNTPQLALHLRTPAMVAALYGSTTVLSYVLSIAPSEAARASASDGATPLLLAHQGRAPSAPHAARLLLTAGASSSSLLALQAHPLNHQNQNQNSPTKKDSPPDSRRTTTKKDYSSASDSQTEDINAGVFATDDFRMYSFKVNPCSRAYTHDWTECPFAHPGENARRRDPRRVPYSCVPCPDFRRDPAACRKGDACEYAHGVFESWLHPAQYRTRLCKDEVGCPRRICFFAHGARQLRAVNPSAASMASPSPTSSSPPRSSRPAALTASLSSRDLDLDADNQAQYARRMMMARANSPPDYSPDLVAAYVQALSSLQQQQHQQNQQQQHQQQNQHQQQHQQNQHQQHQQQHQQSMGMGGLSARAAAFTNRSQTFVHRSPSPAPARSFKSPAPSSMLADWGSPDGKLDWGVQAAELRKSTSFGVRSSSRPHHETTRAEDNMYPSWMKDGSDMLLAARWSDLEQMVA